MEANEYGIDYSCPGFCSLCHCAVAEFDGSFQIAPGIFRLKIKNVLPNIRSSDITLSDGSKMTIIVCEMCENFGPEKIDEIMASEYKGWQKEIEIVKALGQHHENHDKWIDGQKKVSIVDKDTWTDKDRKGIKHGINI